MPYIRNVLPYNENSRGCPAKTKINCQKTISQTSSLLKWIKHVSGSLINLTCQAINKTVETICIANCPNQDDVPKDRFFEDTH